MKKYRPNTTNIAVVARLDSWPPTQALNMTAAKKKTHGIVLEMTEEKKSAVDPASDAADGATSPITSSVQYFRDEYVAHYEGGGCPFDPAASTLFATAGAV